MTQLFYMDVGAISDFDEDRLEERGILPDRIKKIKTYRFLDDKLLSFGAGLLLKEVCARYGVDLNLYRTDERGKPYLGDLNISIAHCFKAVICAVSESPVGCDIERLKTRPNNAARSFTEREREYLSRFSGEEADRQFFRLWTLKESYLKLTGQGVSGLRKCEIIPEGGSVRLIKGAYCAAERCYFAEYQKDGYTISVCSRADGFSFKEIPYFNKF